MSATVVEAPVTANSYLTDGFTLRSWLLTTDHKRIALLYLGTITIFFFVGGAAAALIRYNLIAPEGMIGSAQTYNRLSSEYSKGHVVATVVGIFLAGFSSIATGLNFIVTIHRLRAPGMTWYRMPVFLWSL